ncbi:deaminase [bacterium]|nr:deaminase [bacterium]MDB4802671.1 deaminase [bacterium]
MDNIKLHEYWMRQTIELADQRQSQPFAAIIVDDETQQVLSTGLNDSATHPILHGEIVALQNCPARDLRSGCSISLYSTAEPCAMCQGALIWAQIQTLCFGTSINTLMNLGWSQIDIPASSIAKAAPKEMYIYERMLERECDALFERAIQKP